MATTFKNFTTNDQVSTRTLLHEAIPLTGTIPSGTYAEDQGGADFVETNIKNYSHGMFQSVYDYPYLSSSANHIFDLTIGVSQGSALSGASNTQNAKKCAIYNQMAQILAGHDVTGGIQKFDQDGNIVGGGTKLNEVFFMNFSRLLAKDEIKKGSFVLSMATGGMTTATGNVLSINDSGAASDYRVNSPAGEYAVLWGSDGVRHGLLYYQAGIAVVTASIFAGKHEVIGAAATPKINGGFGRPGAAYDTASVDSVFTASNISASCDGFRNRIDSISFNNTTELNSTIYFCRANHNEFNYSSNPTYITASKLRTKNVSTDTPVSYITSIGLYSADNELLAVAKLSEPLKKDPTNELTLRVRLDY